MRVQSLQTAEDQVGLHPLVRGMLDVVGVCLTKDDEEAARDILISLADLATDVDTRIFKPHMRDFANAMLQIASNTNLDEETRQLALEVELLLIEGRPALIRKDAAMLASVCQVCMGFLLNLEDCKEWHEAVEEEDADAGTPLTLLHTSLFLLDLALSTASRSLYCTPLALETHSVSQSPLSVILMFFRAPDSVLDAIHWQMLCRSIAQQPGGRNTPPQCACCCRRLCTPSERCAHTSDAHQAPLTMRHSQVHPFGLNRKTTLPAPLTTRQSSVYPFRHYRKLPLQTLPKRH